MRIFLTFLASVALMVAWTTPAPAVEVHAGIRGGMNVADLRSDKEDPSDFRNGLAVGGVLSLPVTDMFTVQPEALFMMKGCKDKVGDETLTVKLNYIEVPVLAKMNLLRDSKATPSVFAGPAIAFNTGAKAELETPSGSSETDIDETVKAVDWGFVFGGGLEFGVGEKGQMLGVDLRYTLGVADINDLTGDDEKIQTGTLSITGTFMFI